jgi:hypothetical protein
VAERAMAEVTNELMYEILKKLQTRIDGDEHAIVEPLNGQNAIRGYIASMQSDMTNVYGILTRIDQRLDRIERRLELRELAEPQKSFDPAS